MNYDLILTIIKTMRKTADLVYNNFPVRNNPATEK
ncbi:hypothetical protein J2X97_001286 [Epilithonimonas hungarica]|nr:hypothetical protein [Epilithonimonas hungarica]